ncbi:LysR family transcriptional regulator [Pontibacillus litoralis]|uniref:LysR family transcriptional regulator n=1 Tax=Pontibacillus litoralis JSM 072002 TaxID=1385512 RepID=A0A0A5G3P9_9BACI|nr:LysR family transcriptional regulator [Pontibacillus litoralis]KGX87746.1 LysR family transcriptional regulator [Pontibacillus litoralis JSM 072002]
MEFRQLRYFVSIVNTGSYSAAAKNLFVTQPTLSYNIQKLEKELGTHLFYQSNQSLKLTDSGRLLHEKGQKVLEEMDELVETIQRKNITKKNSLKVGITVLFAIQYMRQIVHFTSTNPHIDVHFIQSGSIDLQKKLANEEIDIGLLSFPIYEPSIHIECINTSNSNYSVDVVMPFHHPLARKKSISFADLEPHTICAFSKDFVLGRVLHERCQEFGFKPNIIFTNNNWEVLLQNTLITNGLTLMPNELKQFSNFINLKWIPLKDKANFFEIGIARRRNEELKDAAARFIEYIKDN